MFDMLYLHLSSRFWVSHFQRESATCWQFTKKIELNEKLLNCSLLHMPALSLHCPQCFRSRSVCHQSTNEQVKRKHISRRKTQKVARKLVNNFSGKLSKGHEQKMLFFSTLYWFNNKQELIKARSPILGEYSSYTNLLLQRFHRSVYF